MATKKVGRGRVGGRGEEKKYLLAPVAQRADNTLHGIAYLVMPMLSSVGPIVPVLSTKERQCGVN